MFVFLTKLILSKQIKFDEGSITLYQQPIVMFPVYTLVDLTRMLEKKCQENMIYYAYKELGVKWSHILKKYYRIKKREIFADAGANIVSMAGWGIVKVLDAEPEKHYVRFGFKNSSVAKAYGKSNHPVCHMFRGMAAGSMCVTYKDNLDAVETKCKSMGAPYCEFIVKPTKRFNLKNPLVRRQLKNKY